MSDPETFSVDLPSGIRLFHHVEDTLSAIGAASALRVVDEVCVQLSGTATAITGVVERSTRDPNTSPNWAPAGDAISGNPATGIGIKRYMEPTRGYWRFRLTAIDSGSVIVDLSGQKA